MTGNNKHLRANDVVRSRKIGGSTFVPLTNYIEPECLFKVSRVSDTKIMLKEVKIVEQEDEEDKIKEK